MSYDKTDIAYHEAAHVVTGIALSFRFESVAIFQPADGDSDWSGKATLAPGQPDKPLPLLISRVAGAVSDVRRAATDATIDDFVEQVLAWDTETMGPDGRATTVLPDSTLLAGWYSDASDTHQILELCSLDIALDLHGDDFAISQDREIALRYAITTVERLFAKHEAHLDALAAAILAAPDFRLDQRGIAAALGEDFLSAATQHGPVSIHDLL